MVARCRTLSGLISVATGNLQWDDFIAMWESFGVEVVKAWQPRTLDDHLTKTSTLAAIRDDERDQRDADLIIHDHGNAEAAGTGGHD